MSHEHPLSAETSAEGSLHGVRRDTQNSSVGAASFPERGESLRSPEAHLHPWQRHLPGTWHLRGDRRKIPNQPHTVTGPPEVFHQYEVLEVWNSPREFQIAGI